MVALWRSLASAATSWGGFLLLAIQRGDIHELGLLDKLARADVQLLLLLGDEADMQSLQVLAYVKLLLAVGTALLVLDGSEEGAQTVNLHALALQQHLYQTTAELLQHTEHHVGGVDTAVLADVLCQLAGVHSFYGLTVGKPLTVNLGQIVFVLSQLIKNLLISLSLMIDDAKVHKKKAQK